ncbi:MAG: DNA starvation/stationary phase protection protein [Prevotellaceae bacterium]|jgi:starvation-inducible DNA-binding protein|nr:DNA starvation/stationary phase protection protein [Prevotellaceae bacterium]
MDTNNKNNVGLDLAATNQVITKLSELLADYQVFYANLRGLHWNIKGDKFYDLHGIYEEYYNEIAEKIDETAERIVILGGTPENNFSEYLKVSKVKEISHVFDWETGVLHVIETLQLLVSKLRKLHATGIKSGDHGSVSLANHGIKSFEKKIWMLSAYSQK